MSAMHRVAALCLDDVVAFDLAVASAVFSLGYDRGNRRLYEFTACAVGRLPASAADGFGLTGLGGRDQLERADTIVVPGYRDILSAPPRPVIDVLTGALDRGGRVVSICTGAFALGYAGILDGRRATTHWAAATELARRFPDADVDPEALYVDDGVVLTSAGLSAGIDLCLHIVRRDHGEEVGAAVARAMVAPPHRDGGQAQFIERPLASAEGSLAEARRWAVEHLAEPIDVPMLAARAGLTPRTFARRFVAETGSTPLQWLIGERVREARRLLETSDMDVEEVAARAGFGSAPSLRAHFGRHVGTNPTAYRRTFRAGKAA